ncbi:leucyl aminopeptidase [Abyssibius alkaniclasticus]|uniref:leucyl aminopeptidase n=1 Tax=Abyssibius alkaniclasticus TaxID=2881234 RepID=UPI002363F17A|nr:leucyl aminopeptidase [Abyssibius alkaniclasticus]UPH70593.1 leucyl aminopeptidase [Abyssibius alkaniclasticus]
MTTPLNTQFQQLDPAAFSALEGQIALTVPADGSLGVPARKINSLARGALARLVASEDWAKAKAGDTRIIAFPDRMGVQSIILAKLDARATQSDARRAGANIAKAHTRGVLHLVGTHAKTPEILLGLVLRGYAFTAYKPKHEDNRTGISVLCKDVAALQATWATYAARAEGVYFTRDLVSEPANVLGTVEFAARLEALRDLGVEVEVLDEPELARLGMRALLGVGQGSASPSKVVVMRWTGAGDARPFALVGKGVVFDTGGISLKPGAGMEEMTCDMGGAGVVSGVMRSLARRKARANVVGVVGLVENMPDGLAQRPGDIVKSMKGDTIEVINTDAEGRLVLADVLWYTQDRFAPVGMIDLATLTGAVVVALGTENAGVFSNNDALADKFLAAAKAEGEGAWRMPLSAAYDKIVDSHIADMRNSCGRPAGSITAAQFLGRFVKDETPWIHLDIAGVTLPGAETTFAPKGATGWGVLALDRFIRDNFEAA